MIVDLVVIVCLFDNVNIRRYVGFCKFF
jgi:hypothetical protein